MSESRYPRHRYLSAEERKREILDVATPMFFRLGYEGTELADVAREAGVSRALLHRHFGGKRGLLMEAVKRIASAPPDTLSTDPTIPLERRIEINTDAWLDHFEANPNLVGVGYAPLGADPEVAEVVDEIRERIIDRALTNYAGGVDVPESLRAGMRGVVALVLTVCHEWLWRERIDRESARRLVIGAVVAMFTDVLPAVGGDAVEVATARG